MKKMTAETNEGLRPEDMYFWLGDDGELEDLNLEQFKARIKGYSKIIEKSEGHGG